LISFWVNASGTFGMEQYLAKRAPQLADRMDLHRYEGLASSLEVDACAHIFGALDQLTASGHAAVAALYDQLSPHYPAGRLLNNPRRVRLRYDLLTTLFDAGINNFRARRVAEATETMRYPVFLREESGHDGPLTGLLTSRRELGRALLALRARGFRADDLLIVEFCDLSDAEGRYRSASAVKVGEHIVPVHLLSGSHWMLKWDESDHDERAMQEHFDYVVENPHEAWVRRIFEHARIDYGRIDYGIRGEELRAWEINTNPTLGPGRGPPAPPLAPKLEAMLTDSRIFFHGALRKAFRSLDSDEVHPGVIVRLDPALLARIRVETRRRQRREALLRLLQRMYGGRRIGKLFRVAYSRFLPRR